MNMDMTCLADGKTGHTPGPWTTDPENPMAVLASDGIFITEVSPPDNTVEQIEQCSADARLIAAGPELLKACEGALLGVTRHPDDTYTIGANAVRILQSAIARAGGRA